MFSYEWIKKEATSAGCIASYESPATGDVFKPYDSTSDYVENNINEESFAVVKFLDKIQKNRKSISFIKRNISKIKDSINNIKDKMSECKNKTTKESKMKCKNFRKKQLKKAKKVLQTANDIRQGLKK